MMPEFTGHRDIRSYIRTIWRWKLLIVVLIAGSGAVAYYLEHRKQPLYESSATVNVSAETVNSSALSGSSSFTTTNIQEIAALITTTPVADIAGALMKPRVSGAEALAGVSASADTDTNWITITATEANPTYAAEVANAFAKAINENQKQAAVGELDAVIKSTKAQLSGMRPSNPDYASLESTLSSYETAKKDQTGDAAIIQPAGPDYAPISPHPKRAAELGIVIGILLAFGAVMLLDSADRRLRSPDELEEFTGLPLLSALAPSAFAGELETTPMDEEAFQTLRTSLTYFTVDRQIKSVLITSPGEQEGKSTVAVRLALAAARAGLDVVLVDADLRRAGATAKLGLKPHAPLGVVLAEHRPAGTAMVDWPLAESDAGRLRVLGAGSPPPNPAALISSEAMRELIGDLESRFDLVIIDTPAALAVSDAVPLMQSVSGVILIARMNRSTRDTVRRLQKIILSAHGSLLGAVATGVSPGPGYEKYSQAYYSTTTAQGRRGRRRRRAKDAAKIVAVPDSPSGSDDIAALKVLPREPSERAHAQE